MHVLYTSTSGNYHHCYFSEASARQSNLYQPNALTLCALPLQDGENKIDPLCPNSAEPEMGKASQPVQALYTKKLYQVRRGVFLPVQWNAGSMHHDRPL